MSKTLLYGGLAAAAITGIVIAVRKAKKLKEGIEVVLKQPHIDWGSITRDLSLDAVARFNLHNHATQSVSVDAVNVTIALKAYGKNTFSNIGNSKPIVPFILTANSPKDMRIPISLQLFSLGLEAFKLARNKGKNEVKVTTTVTAGKINVTEIHTFNV